MQIWSPKRRRAFNAGIRERLKGGKPADTVDYWRKFFGVVAASDFLGGHTAPHDEGPPFRAHLEWLLQPENFAKLIEGRYEGGTSNGR